MLSVPNVQQSPAMCGPASLRAALLAFGEDRSEAELAELSGATPERGTNAIGLLNAVVGCGFHGGLVCGASYDDLHSWVAMDRVPLVDWWDRTEGHWSVVVQVGPKRIALMDPDRAARRWVSRETFDRCWFDYETLPDGSTPTFAWHVALVIDGRNR
jgi:ABC-type bacteriocin/lantibiotic exporter with double-glycine peptidase domain